MPPTTSAEMAFPSKRELTDAELLGQIRAIHAESKGTYGAPRVHKELLHRHVACGKRKVTRLMRQAGLEGRCKKRWRKTTVADPAAQAARDLIQRRFGPCVDIDRRNVGDITYIATWEAGPTWAPSSTWRPPRRPMGCGRSHAHRAGPKRPHHGVRQPCNTAVRHFSFGQGLSSTYPFAIPNASTKTTSWPRSDLAVTVTTVNAMAEAFNRL